jgi:hypothetical protein
MWDENVYLHSDIKAYVSPSQPIFDQMMTLQGKCFRHQEGRITQQILLGNKSYFIKQHFGVGWKEIIKNLLQLRLPVLSAKNEWLAIQKLKALDILVPTLVGYGQRGSNPASLQSFVMTEELTHIISLETLCQTWQTSQPSIALKRHLIKEVARIARTLHQNGMNHRDFYLCHFLLDTSSFNSKQTFNNIEIKNNLSSLKVYLIDLHRAQIRRLTPRRWIIKDLAGLYFSSKDIGLTERDLYRFMKCYQGKSLRLVMDNNKGFWEKVKKRGEKLYRDENK